MKKTQMPHLAYPEFLASLTRPCTIQQLRFYATLVAECSPERSKAKAVKVPLTFILDAPVSSVTPAQIVKMLHTFNCAVFMEKLGPQGLRVPKPGFTVVNPIGYLSYAYESEYVESKLNKHLLPYLHVFADLIQDAAARLGHLVSPRELPALLLTA